MALRAFLATETTTTNNAAQGDEPRCILFGCVLVLWM